MTQGSSTIAATGAAVVVEAAARRQDEALRLMPLPAEDITVRSAASTTPLVVAAPNAGADLTKFMKVHRDAVLNSFRHDGALLFRGFAPGGPAEFESALRALGLKLDGQYEGGASPRSKVSSAIFSSTEVPPPFVIGYHTEMCYHTTRPTVISFYCHTPPARDGETPIFDCAKVLASLPKALQRKLEDKGLRYRRFFPGRRSLINFRKPWYDTFGTHDKAEVEKILRAQGIPFSWDEEGYLMTELNVPAVLVDPVTRKKCLSVTMYDVHTFPYNFRHFRERYNTLLRLGFEWFVKREASSPKLFLRTLFGDGTPFSREESEAVQRAAWENAMIFRWRQGDMLMLNNIRYAHARLNVVKPRRILAALGEPYDVRDFLAQGTLPLLAG